MASPETPPDFVCVEVQDVGVGHVLTSLADEDISADGCPVRQGRPRRLGKVIVMPAIRVPPKFVNATRCTRTNSMSCAGRIKRIRGQAPINPVGTGEIAQVVPMPITIPPKLVNVSPRCSPRAEYRLRQIRTPFGWARNAGAPAAALRLL
jgi:hypothetical protein